MLFFIAVQVAVTRLADIQFFISFSTRENEDVYDILTMIPAICRECRKRIRLLANRGRSEGD